MHSYFFQLMTVGISIGVGLAIEEAMDDRVSGGVAEEERLPAGEKTMTAASPPDKTQS